MQAVLLGLLLAFAMGQLIAWIYMLTHSGLSYSRSFVSSLIVIPVLVSLVMMILSNNLVTAFGMMAVFAIVRLRNILRDTLDTTYILAVLVIGMASGTQRFPIAVTGGLLTCFIMFYLWYTGFGSKHRYDVIVNLHWSRDADELADLGTSGLLGARIDAVLSRMACHGSIRSGRQMRADEMNALLREMEATPLSGQCNHGRPTYVELKLSDIEKLFGRR